MKTYKHNNGKTYQLVPNEHKQDGHACDGCDLNPDNYDSFSAPSKCGVEWINNEHLVCTSFNNEGVNCILKELKEINLESMKQSTYLVSYVQRVITASDKNHLEVKSEIFTTEKTGEEMYNLFQDKIYVLVDDSGFARKMNIYLESIIAISKLD